MSSPVNLNTIGVQNGHRHQRSGWFRSFRLSHQGVAVAVRLATEPDDPSVMHDTVDDRGGHVAVSEHLAPPSKLQIRTERHAPLLVGIRDDLEQESGPVDIDGQVAQLVDDQQPGAAYRAQSRVEPVLVCLCSIRN